MDERLLVRRKYVALVCVQFLSKDVYERNEFMFVFVVEAHNTTNKQHSIYSSKSIHVKTCVKTKSQRERCQVISKRTVYAYMKEDDDESNQIQFTKYDDDDSF